MTSQWKQLGTEDSHVFINAVRSDAHSPLFAPFICDVFLHPLDFFDGYDLIRISNKYSQPYVLLDYISNGENHYYLDGTDHALQTLCVQGCVRLNADNVLDYIDFYFSYVYERGNTVVYIRDQEVAKSAVTPDPAGEFFVINTHLIYQDEMRAAVLHVYKNGVIQIVSPANVTFMDTPQAIENIEYIHPKADSILEQAKALLASSKTAREYLRDIEERGVEICVFSSPNYQAFTINKPVIYVTLPAAQYTADYHQALLLAGGLHDAQQILGGYKRPSSDEDEVLFFNINHDKNLKLIAGMCKIVEELEELEITEAVTAMFNLGLGAVYDGFKNKVSATALMDIYLQVLRDRGLIIEG